MDQLSEPRVSCVVPFLNGEAFFRETIDAVLAQTYPHWELLLVDDGSSDGTSAMARRYASTHSDRIRYIEHPGHANRGVCASRNVGIAAARGEFVALLDADDVWTARKLEEQVRILDEHPSAAMVFGTPLRWHRWPGHGPDVPEDFRHVLGVPANTLVRPPELLLNLLTKEITPLPSDVLIRRSAIESVGGFAEATFTGRFQFYEDQAFFVKLFLNLDVFAADALWTLYRQHDASCVAVVHRSGQFFEKQLIFLEWLEQYFDRHNVRTPELRAALAKLFQHHRPHRPTLRERVAGRLRAVATRWQLRPPDATSK